ncbi:MAG: hypothetical protein J5896_05710 [Alphaproteobacteria bacterium]|nr:hypothetical protein [Alphaproteobacteria bacterium]
MDKLIWFTVLFLVFLAFYSLYNPLLKRRLIDEIVAAFGTVGMIGLAIVWSFVAFGNSQCSEGWKYFLIIVGAIVMIFGLILVMELIMVIWGGIISLFIPKHAEKIFKDPPEG